MSIPGRARGDDAHDSAGLRSVSVPLGLSFHSVRAVSSFSLVPKHRPTLPARVQENPAVPVSLLKDSMLVPTGLLARELTEVLAKYDHHSPCCL